MNIKTIIRIAKPLRAVIGAHARLIGTGCDNSVYQRARADSDLAVRAPLACRLTSTCVKRG